MDARIRPLIRDDWPQVRGIYEEGIATGDATFETEVPPWDAWQSRHSEDTRLIAEVRGVVLGFAAVSPVSQRTVYRGVAEVMVYVAAHARGEGIGRLLLEALVTATERAGIWSLQAGIFPENEASLALHRAVGFRTVGVRSRIGRAADGRWRDTLLLERRSERIGID